VAANDEIGRGFTPISTDKN